MAYSDVAALLLREKFLASSWAVKTHLSDHTSRRFEDIRKHLEGDITFLTGPQSIPLLHKLNDALAHWRTLKEHKNVIKEFFSRIDAEGQRKMDDALSPIEKQLTERPTRKELDEGSGRPPTGNRPDFLLDRFTSYNSGSSHTLGFDQHVRTMKKCLWESGEGFNAVGIYGMGGSGKTALVKKVLNSVTDGGRKDEPKIIWTCLSDLTREDEIDIKIAKHILYDLGFDIDSMPGTGHEDDDDWLMKQLERELNMLGNYVLVLDDVWHCSEWLTFVLYPTLAKTAGGALIVTSRIKKVATKIVGRANPDLIDLNPRDDNNNNVVDVLEKMVRQSEHVKNDVDANGIIGECHGLPLAAELLPSLNAQNE